MTPLTFSLGSPVYIRYKDHVLFKNIQQPMEEAMERETIGWLSRENGEIILVEHDRTMPNAELCSGQSNGLIILKSCIIEIRKLPLQESSKWHLNSQETTDKAEYALQPKKRKTPKRNRTGAKK
ncbi:MAG: hypothetical protein ABSG33_01950 [Candidatus Bathyarchaeia archaeon]